MRLSGLFRRACMWRPWKRSRSMRCSRAAARSISRGITALEAALDDSVQLYGIQTATNTGSPLLIVNGPIAATLKLNARGNVFGQGFRANATIGRALQLILRNVGGDIAGRNRYGHPRSCRKIHVLHRRE